MDGRARLLGLLAERSFRIGDFTLASGRKSRYYVDARMTTLSAEGQALIGALGLQAIDSAELKPDAVGGLTMGADPIAYAIAHRSFLDGRPIDAFTVRKQPKDHGVGRQIEGCLEAVAADLYGATYTLLQTLFTELGAQVHWVDVADACDFNVKGPS